MYSDPAPKAGYAGVADVLIVAHFSADDPTTQDRFSDLAENFAIRGATVELVTSSFSHTQKAQRTWVSGGSDYERTHIYEPGYRQNVGWTRILSHRRMAVNLREYLSRRKRPNLIYCAVPSISVARAVANYAARSSISLVIDVQDLWPETFQLVSPLPLLTRLLIRPLVGRVNEVYRAADGVVAVSQTFLERALEVRRVEQAHIVAYLGIDLGKFDSLALELGKSPIERSPDEICIAYVGTLGHSYDLPLVFEAMSMASKWTDRRMRLVVMGDGPLMESMKEQAREACVTVEFHGRLPYSEMVPMLLRCDVAVNPIRSGTAASVINKVCDYAAAGLPVLNTQDSREYRELVDTFKAGINCTPGNAESLALSLVELVDNPSLRRLLGRNNRRLAEKLFDRRKSYPEVVDFTLAVMESRGRGSRALD